MDKWITAMTWLIVSFLWLISGSSPSSNSSPFLPLRWPSVSSAERRCAPPMSLCYWNDPLALELTSQPPSLHITEQRRPRRCGLRQHSYSNVWIPADDFRRRGAGIFPSGCFDRERDSGRIPHLSFFSFFLAKPLDLRRLLFLLSFLSDLPFGA